MVAVSLKKKKDSKNKKKTTHKQHEDEKQECDNGERRVGAAIDYMDGSSEYTGVGGSGDVSRKGIWLYDTWLGDKGHYSDFVAKWGHLSNDFTLYRGGDKITGDFSNNVYSISAEYGRKKDIGNNWYFEPQVQLQYARVTDANYTTSQGTEVSLDAINSLIARAGFRLGKDLGERSTVYFKADLLHEFLTSSLHLSQIPQIRCNLAGRPHVCVCVPPPSKRRAFSVELIEGTVRGPWTTNKRRLTLTDHVESPNSQAPSRARPNRDPRARRPPAPSGV